MQNLVQLYARQPLIDRLVLLQTWTGGSVVRLLEKSDDSLTKYTFMQQIDPDELNDDDEMKFSNDEGIILLTDVMTM